MNLDDELSKIKGVGPKTAEKLAAAGFATVGDLVEFLPRAYEDFSRVSKISELKPAKVTIRARAESVNTRPVRRGMRVTTAVMVDDSGKVQAVWFNQPYRETQLKSGAEFFLSGEFGFRAGRYQLTSPSAEAVKDLPVQTGRILPIYPAVKGLKPALTRSVLGKLRPLITMLPETLPAQIVARERLMSRADAMLGLHFPESAEQADAARERLAFEELFELLLAARLNKRENSKLSGFRIPFDQPKIKQFVGDLPFVLTGAQRRALWDILCDFENPSPMNRLLQGDVGSGKTVVAGAAGFQAVLAGFQAAIMAPTEILASQHADTLGRLLEPYGVNVALLTSSVKGAARAELLERIADGTASVVVGTHALFQPAVKFHKLGFVVIDEQHRFGVKQRQALLAKSHAGAMPHLLAMTATPIPRSLQLTLFGDLDNSILNELPRGRQPIVTKIYSPNRRAELYEKIREQLTLGRQAYVITPLIEENGQSDKKSVEATFKQIKRVFDRPVIASAAKQSSETEPGLPRRTNSPRRDKSGYAVGLLHGRQTPAEKEKVMRDFAAGKIDILVATTVVEVGVDVPNASVVVIENADQFGLAQLHQLRGRVGRGEHQSYCFLVTSDSSAPTRRLREIEKSGDGFYLAEVDLKLRGPGEIYGARQHGELNLQIASLADTKLIARAARAADEFIATGADLAKYPTLDKNIQKYQRLTTLN
ncbi:MAG: ATP-dependent DNA helicase RecG [Candidatus Nomurabacteria bacterium]|nr:ATP-dependent DNA helicase RecG [Candidatus Nomurabacteria bacterium]